MRLSFVAEPDDADFIIPASHVLQPHGTGEMELIYTCNKTFSTEKTITVYPVVNGTRLTTPLTAVILAR
jgi:hypothetical protein